ncbi:MAG TPA: GNAT family N-acetyltransferase [Stellaceae bacterium]
MGSDAALAHRVEEACLKGWPALQQIWFDGWLLRFAEGHTRRANSVNPSRPSRRGLREKIAYCEAAYRAQGLPVIFRISALAEHGLDERLGALGYGAREDETCVVYRRLAAGGELTGNDAYVAENAPSEQWLEAHACCTGNGETVQRVQRRILQALSVPAVFTAARGEEGRLASLAFGAVHDKLVCINLVVTDPALRRRGLARRAVTAVLTWARDQAGADGACLAVVADNLPARALYRQLGFDTELYRYHYRHRAVPPDTL